MREWPINGVMHLFDGGARVAGDITAPRARWNTIIDVGMGWGGVVRVRRHWLRWLRWPTTEAGLRQPLRGNTKLSPTCAARGLT